MLWGKHIKYFEIQRPISVLTNLKFKALEFCARFSLVYLSFVRTLSWSTLNKIPIPSKSFENIFPIWQLSPTIIDYNPCLVKVIPTLALCHQSQNFNITSEYMIIIRDGLPKKSSCSFGFCPNEGGGRALPAQIFCPLFINCIYWVNLGMGPIRWGGRGRPLPKFFGTLAFKKSGTSCPN